MDRHGLGRVAVCGLVLAALSACGGGDDPAPPAKSLAESCAEFAPAELPYSATITKTEIRAASDTLPEVCIVRGEIVSSPASTINWAVELPAAASWNGKTITVGGGGFDGFIPTDSNWYHRILGASANPYVKMSSDSGHQSQGFEWALDEVALRNHGYEANHMVLGVGTQLATAFYGKAPTRRYQFGQSNGGRSGLVAAQRYPDDYDGVIALAPAIAQEGFAANNGPILFKHFAESTANWLSPEKVALFAAAEVEACDGLDGLKDGIIGNVNACTYIPTDKLCAGAESDTCFTAGQIESIRRIYTDRSVPVTLADGVVGYPRYGRGGASTGDWTDYMFGRTFEQQGSDGWLATAIAQVVENDPSVTLATHDPTLHAAEYLRISSEIDCTNPDLSAFADGGGKLLVWYGVGDACVSMYRLTNYLDTVEGQLGTTKTRSFIRHITSPSTGHDFNGPEGTFVQIDFVGLLDAWVESENPPEDVIETRLNADGEPVSTRPACEYPKFPRYDGNGDPSKAESFTCSAT